MAEVAERYGPYTCVRRLGVGGMAETFLAVQHGAAGFEQRVCMKFMLPALRNEPAFRQLFLREATIAASLRHANIVGVIDVDGSAGYIVLELVDGVDLRTLLNATPNRRLPSHVVGLIAVELCKALAYAHGRTRRGLPDGIVHRDISPSNVLVSHNGEVKLTDFGVAKAMRGAAEPSSGGIKGKLCYMSPEQTRGDHLDGRSDLFSLGIMLYELLAGVRPFDGPSDAQTLLRIEAGRHTPLAEVAPDVPGAFALVIERLLRSDVEHRYPTADACIDALARLAPPITTYRELGQLARAARAPVTLSSAEFGMATPGSGPRPLELLHHTRRSAVAPPTDDAHADRRRRAFEAQPVTVPDTAALPAPPKLAASPSPRPRLPVTRRFSGVSRTAWFTLGASLCAGALVALAWLARLGWGPLESAALNLRSWAASAPIATSGSAAEAPIPPPTAEPEPSREPAPDPEPAHHSPLLQPQVPTTRNPGLPPQPNQAARPAPTAEANAVLRVGTVPLGQVWIDGEAAGWSPVVVDLPPGVHSIAGGNTSPEVTRSVRLRAGETRRLVLSLEADPPPRDEPATPRAD